MKALILVILVISSAGCTALGTIPGTQRNSEYTIDATATDAAPAPITPPFQDQNIVPRMIIPVSGGAPSSAFRSAAISTYQ
jgi:hypothetical protein